MAFAVIGNQWLVFCFLVLSAKVKSVFCWPCPVPTVHRRVSEWWVGGIYIGSKFTGGYNHHLKDLSYKEKWNKSQQWLQFVLLLTATYRIKTIVIPNENLNSQWWLVQNRLGYLPRVLSHQLKLHFLSFFFNI